MEEREGGLKGGLRERKGLTGTLQIKGPGRHDASRSQMTHYPSTLGPGR